MQKLVLLLFLVYLFTSTVSAQHVVIAQTNTSINEVAKIIIIEAYKRANIPLKIVVLPNERALFKANSGELDGDLLRGMVIQKSHPNIIPIPVSISTAEVYPFVLNKDLKINKWKDLQKYRLEERK